MASAFDREAARKWLNEKWEGNKLCPVSGHNDWTLANELVEVRPFSGGGFVVGGNVYPHVMLTCSECGYTLLFSAVRMGLLKKEESDE